jgi:hypothetical protein
MNKPGFTTSEFWSTLITQVLALIALVHPSTDTGVRPEYVQAFALLASAVAAAAYAHGRSKVKVAAGSAVATAPGPPTDLHTEPLVTKEGI